jgi:hypothetical protein
MSNYSRLIRELENEKMMMFTLALNDDLVRTLERYKDIKKGIHPLPFESSKLTSD